MEKIKSIFRPGGDKDDAVMYGTPEPKNIHDDGTSGQGSNEEAAKPSTQTDPRAGEEEPATLQTSAMPGTPAFRLKHDQHDAMSTMSIKSGVQGPYAKGEADSAMVGSEPSASQEPTTSGAAPASTERSFPLSGGVADKGATDDSARYGADEAMRSEPSTTTADQSHLGRDAGLASAGTAGAGTLGHEDAFTPRDDYAAGAQDTDSSFPLGATSAPTDTDRHFSEPGSSVGAAGGGGPHIGGMGMSDGGGGQVDSTELERPLSSSAADIPGDPFGYHHPDEKPVEGYVHHTQGPHATDIANVLDPHVPGEFPGEDGEDRHKGMSGAGGLGGAGLGGVGEEAPSTVGGGAEPTTAAAPTEEPSHLGRDVALGGAGLGAAGLGAAGYEASQPHGEPSTLGGADPAFPSASHPIATTTNTMPSAPAAAAEPGIPEEQPEHHYGRDAALAGGAGAAGLGGYEALKDRGEPAGLQQEPTATSGVPSQADPGVQSYPPQPEEKDTHYGRDAALAGGAGAAGVGAYEATKDRGDTGPASKTIGPHDSNVANVMDPRVQPEPERMKEDEHHYGRDAAIAGGAGAAGLGAYEATRPDEQAGPTKEELAQRAKEEKAAQKAHEKEEKAAEKQHAKEEKKEEKKAEKAHEKEEKRAEKAYAKEEKAHAKEQEAAEKEAAEREAAQRKALEEQQRKDPEEDEHHYGRDAAVAGGAGAAGVGAYEASRPSQDHDRYGDDGKLHKTQHQMEKHERDLQKAREKEAQHGGDRGHEREKKEGFLHKLLHHGGKDKDKHADDRTPSSPSQQHAGHVGTDGPIGNKDAVSGLPESESGAAGDGEGGKDGYVTDPHTGLPMNVGKYGHGEGGTDGAPQIGGFHGDEAGEGKGADWEGIRKANTPY